MSAECESGGQIGICWTCMSTVYRNLLHLHLVSDVHRLDMTEVVRLEKPHLPHMNEVVISVTAEYE